MSITLRAKRILTGALAGAMVLGLLPAGVASAATTACQGAASGTFTDSNPTHQANIDCVAAYGVVTGFANGTFGGSQNITRGQMATFIARFAATTLNVPITDIAIASHTFTDVAGNVHADNIARIFGLNVTAGRTATTFAPNDTITRAEAATMLANAHVALGVDLSGVTPSTAFTDLGTSVHADNINLLAGAGVVSGKTATTFAPSASILRAEAATLLVRSITVLRSQNIWAAPPLVAPSTGLTISPAGAVTLDGTAGSTNVTYTVTGLKIGSVYDIALVEATEHNTTGPWRVGGRGTNFALASGNRTADVTGGLATAAEVAVDRLNGFTITSPAATASFNATTTTMTFRVSRLQGANHVAQDFYPVVTLTESGANANVFAVNLAGTPKVDHVIGGRVKTDAPTLPTELTTASEAADTTIPVSDTVSTSAFVINRNTTPAPSAIASGSSFTAAGAVYWMRDSDVYQYQGSAITRAQFLSIYSVGDVVEIDYKKGTAVSTFNIITDAKPAAPTFDPVPSVAAGSSTVTISLTGNANTTPAGTSFQVQRRDLPATPANSVGAWVDVATVVQAASGVTTVTDNPGNGSFEYRVRSVNPVSNVTSDWGNNGSPAKASIKLKDVTTPTAVDVINLEAKEIGRQGNLISVTTVAAGPGSALSVSVSGNDITVNLRTNSSNEPLSTATEVVNAINASAAAAALVAATVETGQGDEIVAVAAKANLAGGVSTAVTTPATADNLPPLAAMRTYLVTNAAPVSTLSQGDVVKIVFNRPIFQPAAGATIVYDAGLTLDSTATTGNATFAINTSAETVDGVSFAAGRVLTITMTSTPASGNVLGTGNLAANATAATGILPNTTVPGGTASAGAWAGTTGTSDIQRDIP